MARCLLNCCLALTRHTALYCLVPPVTLPRYVFTSEKLVYIFDRVAQNWFLILAEHQRNSERITALTKKDPLKARAVTAQLHCGRTHEPPPPIGHEMQSRESEDTNECRPASLTNCSFSIRTVHIRQRKLQFQPTPPTFEF
ncbi:unnamed protein product [Periconia digitata]|uniref:Secreted protein n=1 Tax=Periconia digitata TaxID=1303443 RepID=A0A9W4UMU1_9PLEO|nr:unnamed protein product [Periconia digitata]